MDNIALRDAFWNRIFEIAQTNTDIIVVSADMGAPALDQFRRYCPDQFVNVGIAEQNGLVLSAGMAMEGKHCFLYGIAPFVTFRCLEQIRVSCSLMDIPVTIVGVGVGFGYDESGPTHHLIEDIAIMRSMPNMTIHNVTDNVMAAAVAQESCGMKSANYVRLDRQVLPAVYEKDADFSTGFAVLREGEQGYIIGEGAMTHQALALAEALAERGISMGVIDMYRITCEEAAFVALVKDCDRLITIEEHFLAGGMGSYVLELLNDSGVMLPVKRLGLSHEKGYSYTYGGRHKIHEYYGIDMPTILAKAEDFMK